MSEILDVGPVNVRGAINGSRNRVIWKDGKLYIAHSYNNVRVLETPSKPEYIGDTWVAQTFKGTVKFSRRGCATCGFQLKSIKADKLIAIAK